jgi:hypothetical protein
MRSLRALMAANSRCTHIVAAMPHPKPTTNIVIPLARLLSWARFCHVHAMALPKDRTVATVERIVMIYEEEWVATAAGIVKMVA